MKTFVVYDARREQAFVRFPCDGSTAAESGYLDAGLLVEFGQGDPARVFMVVVEHPFFARSAGFVDQMTTLLGRTVVQRLWECYLRHETVVDEVGVDDIELEALTAACPSRTLLVRHGGRWWQVGHRPVQVASSTWSSVRIL